MLCASSYVYDNRQQCLAAASNMTEAAQHNHQRSLRNRKHHKKHPTTTHTTLPAAVKIIISYCIAVKKRTVDA